MMMMMSEATRSVCTLYDASSVVLCTVSAKMKYIVMWLSRKSCFQRMRRIDRVHSDGSGIEKKRQVGRFFKKKKGFYFILFYQAIIIQPNVTIPINQRQQLFISLSIYSISYIYLLCKSFNIYLQKVMMIIIKKNPFFFIYLFFYIIDFIYYNNKYHLSHSQFHLRHAFIRFIFIITKQNKTKV